MIRIAWRALSVSLLTVAACGVTATASAQASPAPGKASVLLGVQALSKSSAWSVGYYCTSGCGRNETDHSLILHWNGRSWSRVASPQPGTFSRLSAVAAVSPRNIWAAGTFHNTNFSTCGPLFEHYDGKSWSDVSGPLTTTCDTISALSARSAKDMWAVGSDFTDHAHTLIMHGDGASWTQVASPNPGSTTDVLTSVSAVAANSAWAAGYFCTRACSSVSPVLSPLILHWDGKTWTRMPVPGPRTGRVLNDITAVSGREAWAVGYTTRSFRSVILHWNGKRWAAVSSPDEGALTRAAFSAPRDGWALGGTLALHWNGTSWSPVALPHLDLGVQSASARTHRDVWAVGDYCQGRGCTRNPPVLRTLTLHWNGTSWSRQ